jgi:uncharacterized protein YkwD
VEAVIARIALPLVAMVALCAQTPNPEEAAVPLTIPVTHLYVHETDERKMLDDVNALRRAKGLKPLVLDAKLAKLARAFARDMLTRRFFGHRDPDGRVLVDRLRAAGYTFRHAAENIAVNRDEEGAETALEASPGHRRNMLDPAYSRAGIGAVAASVYGVAFVQEFAGE